MILLPPAWPGLAARSRAHTAGKTRGCDTFTLAKLGGAPNDIPDLGDAGQTPRQNPGFDPSADISFTAEDYFVWSRVDGATSLRQLVFMTGFGRDKAVGILRKLWSRGALVMPGETPESAAARLAAAPAAEEPAGEAPAVEHQLTPEEQAALAEEVALSEAEKLRVLDMLRYLGQRDYFALLGVERRVTRRELKRAYFRLSKAFHPDRYYGKNVGSFGPWLDRIFEAAGTAFETLSDERSRAAYEAWLRGDGEAAPDSPSSQTPAEQARDLYEEACGLEIRGNSAEALRLFSSVARIDPRARYLRRAASCAINADELKAAEEYAKQAVHLEPQDPSFLRLLADVYRAAGKLREAERTLVSALELKTENDVLATEIEDDLAAVRDQL